MIYYTNKSPGVVRSYFMKKEIFGGVINLLILSTLVFLSLKFDILKHLLVILTYIVYYTIKHIVQGKELYKKIGIYSSGVLLFIGLICLGFINNADWIVYYSIFLFAVILIDCSYRNTTGYRPLPIVCAILYFAVINIIIINITNTINDNTNGYFGILFYLSGVILFLVSAISYVFILNKVNEKALFTNILMILQLYGIEIYLLIQDDVFALISAFLYVFSLSGLAIAILCNAIYYLIKARKREKIEDEEINQSINI